MPFRHPTAASTPQEVEPRFQSLFRELESRLHTAGLSSDKWYLLAVSTIVAGPHPESADQLYRHLISREEHSTPRARQYLIRRLREALFKSTILVGVPKPIVAILSISRLEQEQDKDYTCTRESWQCNAFNHVRGMSWFKKVYAQNAASTIDIFSAHRDFEWLTKEITYGLFLSDMQVLGDIDTQMVVLPAIMSQNLKNPSHWHIRGTMRLGLSKEDMQAIWDCVRLVTEFFETPMDNVPFVDEVEPDV
ncbi:unnamed protein product [Penicillium egyptiacum]|uniref:Uncharacterized protein n=1 Tax=Penicillium egyptiacum TaxID=1303716 RepID=A0A9W4KAB1_9EURO|nr:unnamed protein product [Penicillium egyptiacum]